MNNSTKIRYIHIYEMCMLREILVLMSHKLFVFLSIIVGCIQLFYSKLLNHEFLGTLIGLQHKTHYYLIAQNQDAEYGS